jgi:hypothetical protein
MNVIIIGTGNIARFIGKRLFEAGHTIKQVLEEMQLLQNPFLQNSALLIATNGTGLMLELIFISWQYLIMPFMI